MHEVLQMFHVKHGGRYYKFNFVIPREAKDLKQNKV